MTVGREDISVQLRENSSSPWEDANLSIISQEQFENSIIACRVSLQLDIPRETDSLDVFLSRISTTRFQLKDSELVLRAADGDSSGVVSYGVGLSSAGQCFGDVLGGQPVKFGYRPVESVVFDALMDSEEVNGGRLQGECVSYAFRSQSASEVGTMLLSSLQRQLKLAQYWFVDRKVKGTLETLTALPYKVGHLLSLQYPEEMSDDDLQDYRLNVNKVFLLPPCPFVSRKNAYEFADLKSSYHLYNTHVGLKPTSVKGLTGIVQGIYSYHHYMQDKFNDNKWGCAYRSLQTIVSWFRHQGFSNKPVPSHEEIQKCLVDLGDKPSKFIGSTDWIGSTEVGFVLESYLGVTSKVISVSSGDELSEKGRELVQHFNTQGTPVMIGGGVLAHTILGVSFDPSSGDIEYLILDPHYTGSEDLTVIQKQGWCGWKGPKFWNAKAYYNLCLPQRPKVV
ncbi:hypothetical protein HAZT_HAZT008790 [Hyalella azteca]|nr:hypothetical protein HAZT_HAZT008790 [Hyalella azteca]